MPAACGASRLGARTLLGPQAAAPLAPPVAGSYKFVVVAKNPNGEGKTAQSATVSIGELPAQQLWAVGLASWMPSAAHGTASWLQPCQH